LSYGTVLAHGHSGDCHRGAWLLKDSGRIAFIRSDLRLHAEAHRTKRETHFRGLDADATWFVALAKEQLALIANDGFHGTSFG